MALESVLIAGEWRPAVNPPGTLRAVNPRTKETLPAEYPVSGSEDVIAALTAAQEAVVALREITPAQIADFLEAFANNIEARAHYLSLLADTETALGYSPRLHDGELPRTTDQLRQAANAARDGSWRLATIDTESDIRSMYGPLSGPVVVFGPNNFPFAFNSERAEILRLPLRRAIRLSPRPIPVTPAQRNCWPTWP